MSRYIDFHLIGELVDSHGNVHYEDLKNLPTADVVERKHGKWIQDKNVVMGEGYVWYCSECSWARFYGFNEPIHNYCPNCGAEMKHD